MQGEHSPIPNILTVEYRRLRTFGSYQNETIGAVAQVGEHDQPWAVLAELRNWVDEQLGDNEERSSLKEAISELEWRKQELERQVRAVESRWTAITAFLSKLGVERPADIPDTLEGIPF